MTETISDLESLLEQQAHMLHGVFTKAVEQYATGDVPEKSRVYGTIALKAQNYCRMTVSALNLLKEKSARLDAFADASFSTPFSTNAIPPKKKKSSNELYNEQYFKHKEWKANAPMDAGKQSPPSSIDHWLAAMEEGGG